MSTTIDQKVVEMRFDNQHFEKNVNTTMSSLDKLKQKLNFSGASKGLDELNNSAKNNNMGVLANSVEVVRNKFSALEVMGVTALANLTNSAVNAGKRIVKSLTVDPVTTGFNEYELKMGSVQTIMASTGESLEVVNSYLNELNKYSDQTIYSFSDMTQNIGKFTNAGVKLEDAVMAIKGISNEAALSGANANEASRAMYNFAQALSAGYVKLIDWKSIENANMATVGFKEELIKSAVAAGTLEKQADGMYKVLTTNAAGSNMKDTISATKLFNDSLNYQWMTTEVLVNTLKDYADETTEIGKKASQAATEVKTFSQMMDTLKESAQSGWATTWEIVFGDFYEGKELWTGISKVVGGLIDKMSDLRNNMLRGALTSPWEKLNKKIQDAGLSTEDFNEILEEDLGATVVKELTEQYGSLADAIKKGKVPVESLYNALKKLLGKEEDVTKETKNATGATKAVVKTLEDLDGIVKKVMRGDFGNGADRIKKLTEAGYDYATVQNKINELMGVSKRHTSTLTEAQQELLKSQGKQVEQLAELTDAQLKEKGYTEEQIKALRELNEVVDTGRAGFKAFEMQMAQKSGRELLLESFQHIGEQIKKIFEAISLAWNDAFGDQEDLTSGLSLRSLIEQFHDLTTSITVSEETAEKFRNIMKGVFDGLKLGGSMASKSVLAGLKILDAVLGLFEMDLMSAAEFVALKISEAYEWIDKNTIFGWDTGYEDLAKIFLAIIDGVSKCVKAFAGLEKVQAIIKRLKDSLSVVKEAIQNLFGDVSLGSDFLSIDNITKAIENFFTKIETFIKNLDNLGEGESIGENIVLGVAKGIQSAGTKVIDAIISVGTALVTAFCDFFGIESPSRLMFKYGGFIVQGLKNGITNGAKGLADKILSIGKIIVNTIEKFFIIKSPSRLMMTIGGFIIAGLIAGLVSKNTEIGTAIENLTDFCINGFKNLGSAIADIVQKIDFGKLLAIGLSAGLIWAIKSLADAVALFTSPLAAFEKAGKSIANFFDGTGKAIQKAIKLNSQSKALMNLAIAIAVLAASVWVLAQLDGNKLLGATVAILVLAGALVGMTVALEKLGKVSEFKFNYLSLLGIAAALMMMAITFNLLSKFVDKGNVGKTVAVFIAMSTGLVLMMRALAKVANGKDAINIKGAGKVFTKLAFALLIMVGVIKLISLLQPGEIIKGIATITALTILFRGIIKVFRGTSDDAEVIKQSGKCIRRIATSLLLMIGVIKVASMLSTAEIIRGGLVVAGLTAFFAGIIYATKMLDTTQAKQIEASGNMMLKVAGAMLIMALAVKLVGGMSLSEIGKGILVIGSLSLLCAALIRVSKYSGKHAAKAGAMLIEVSAALILMSLALYLLAGLDSKGVVKSLGIITAISAIFAGLMFVTKYTKYADKAKGAIIALTIAIGVLAIAIVALSLLDQEKVKSATQCLASVIGMFALLVAATSCLKAGKKTWVRNLVTIGVLTLVAIALGCLIERLVKDIKNPAQAVGVAQSIGTLLLALSSSLFILSKSKSINKKNLPGILATLNILLLVSAALGLIVTKLGPCDPKSAIGAATGAGILLLAMSESLNVISRSKSISKKKLPGILATLAMLTLVSAALGLVIKSMNDCNPIRAVGSAIALSILLIALSTAFDQITMSKGLTEKKLNSALVMLGTLTLVVGALGVVIYHLAKQDPLRAIGAATALSILLGALSVSFNVIANSKGISEKNLPGVINTLALMTGALAVSAVLIAMLSQCDPISAVASSIALGIMLTALSASFRVIAGSKGISEKNLPGMINTLGMLTIMAVVATGLIAILSFCDPTKAIGSSIALSILLVSLSFSMNILSKAVGITTAAVYPAMLMGVVLLELALVLGVMQAMNVNPSIETAAALSLLLIALSAACLILSKVGPMAPMAVQGAVGLIGVIAVLGTAAILLGEVMSWVKPEKIEKWKNGLESFLDFIVILAEGLGEIIGAFVGGVMSGLSDGLIDIGDALGEFMDGAQPFIDGCSAIGANGNLLKGVSMLSLALIEFGAAGLISAVTSIGGITWDLIGWQLTNFWNLSQGFFNGLAEVNPKVISGAKSIAETLMILTKADLLDQWFSFATGNNTLAEFGAQFGALGTSINEFVTNLGTIDVTSVGPACDIIRELATVANELPNDGGWIGKIVGENSLGTFAGYLPDLGTNLANFVKNVGTFSNSQVTAAECAGDVIKALATAASKIPNEGGKIAEWFGDNGLAGFAMNLPDIGGHLSNFIKNLGTIDPAASDSVTVACDAIAALAKAAGDLPNEGGKLAEWFGDNGLGTFAGYLPGLGENLKLFITSLGTLSDEGTVAVDKAVEIVKAIAGLGDVNLNALTTDLGNFSGLLGSFADCMVNFVNRMSEVSTCDVGMAISKLQAIIDFAKTASGLSLDSLSSLSTGLKDVAQNGVKAFVDAFNSKDVLTDVKNAAIKMMDEFIAGVESKLEPVKTAFEDMVSESLDAIDTQSNYNDFKDVGKYLVEGFAAGIDAKTWYAEARAIAMANAAEKAAKDALDINSPSKVFMRLGSGVVEGFAKGINDNTRDSTKSSEAMANESIKGFSSAISRINDYFSGNIDAQPTIRPVLDLSDVKSGAASISGMFNTPTVGVATNVSAINTMMNQRNQNGPNADVISALDKLRGDLGNIGGTSYNINGITYDDGSNIANAIKVIARAAVQEGRI